METGPFSSALRMFMSVDIVGSTAFKQAAKDRALEKSASDDSEPPPAEPWFSPIAQFYRGIERIFAREWMLCTEASDKVDWPAGKPPELWKSVGDELIYTKLLSDHREALTTLNAWMKTVDAYRKRLKAQYPSLDLKSTAWVAGFPVHNAEVVFRSSVQGLRDAEDEDDEVFSNLALLNEFYADPTSPNLTKDYIGPAIDTGFRLSQLSTPRRLVISVELALLLVHAVRTQPHDYAYERPRFFFEGRHSLKGVFGGLPYPIFWLDMRPAPALEDSEDELNARKPLGTDAVLTFCHEFVKASDGYCFTPYIVGNSDPTFNRVPDRHVQRLEGLRSYWEKEAQKRADEKVAGLEKTDSAAAEQSADESLAKILRELDPGATEGPAG
ncbi:hypothetical protein ACVIWU_008296 [Bradyrhizobium sp. USDA 4509]